MSVLSIRIVEKMHKNTYMQCIFVLKCIKNHIFRLIKKIATFTKIFSKNCCNLQKYMVQCILPVKKGSIMPKSNRLICDDTGGGCARRRKFPWSMSDFQTGRLCNTAQGGSLRLNRAPMVLMR